MKRAPLAALVLICTTCATAPEREGDRLCGAQGRSFVIKRETHEVGGTGSLRAPREKVDPAVTGGPRDLGWFSSDEEPTIGLGNLGPIRPPQPPAPAPAGLVLDDVKLGHDELGRGGQVDGRVRYASHAGAKIVLEATTTTPGYGWSVELRAS